MSAYAGMQGFLVSRETPKCVPTPLSTALGATRPLPGLPVTPVLHRHGVHTVSLSEDGFEKVFQGTAVWPTWPLSLRPGQELTVRITIQIQETGSGHATSHHLPV